MGGNTIQKAVWLSFVISSGMLMLNAAKNIDMLRSPAASKEVMVGEKLDLQWQYYVKEMAQYKWKISLYVYNDTEKSKKKVLILNATGGISNASKAFPALFKRLDLKLSYNEARISIPTTTFYDKASYGIMFEPSSMDNTDNKTLQEATDVKIVDMFIDEALSSTFLYSWIGQPVKFVCKINLKPRAESPYFKWKNVDKNITITENITVSRERSVLEITPKDESDFGSYKCYVDTYRTNIKRNMTLLKVEYPGYPILVNFSLPGKSLSWMAATQMDGKKSSFTIQYLQNRKRCIWLDVNKTSDLSISIFSLSQHIPEHTVKTCSVRVCVSGQTLFNNVSCSREHKIYSKISPRPTVNLKYDSKRVTLSWWRQKTDTVKILGYVIQIFRRSKSEIEEVSYIHLKKELKSHTFSDKATVEDALVRLCIRNTLCIFEQACSKKVGMPPVFPSKPRSVQITFLNNSRDVKLSWLKPAVTGKGSLSYIVEIQKGGIGTWKQDDFTTQLETTLISPSLNDHIRVCAKNNYVERSNLSCSESYDLKKLKMSEVGSSGYTGNNSFIVFILMTSLTTLFIL